MLEMRRPRRPSNSLPEFGKADSGSLVTSDANSVGGSRECVCVPASHSDMMSAESCGLASERPPKRPTRATACKESV